MSVNSSGTIQVRPIWPVQGSPQACTLEPCRNQPRWKGLAATVLLLLRARARMRPRSVVLGANDVPGVARSSSPPPLVGGGWGEGSTRHDAAERPRGAAPSPLPQGEGE